MKIEPISIHDPRFNQEALDRLVEGYNDLAQYLAHVTAECSYAIRDGLGVDGLDPKFHVRMFAHRIMKGRP